MENKYLFILLMIFIVVPFIYDVFLFLKKKNAKEMWGFIISIENNNDYLDDYHIMLENYIKLTGNDIIVIHSFKDKYSKFNYNFRVEIICTTSQLKKIIEFMVVNINNHIKINNVILYKISEDVIIESIKK